MEEKVTPDSQKSGIDKASESVTSTGDKLAGSVQPGKPPSRVVATRHEYETDILPGDSKSTTQKLSDQSRSTFDSAQDTVGDYSKKASDNLPSSGDVQGTVDDVSKKASDSLPSQGEAEGTSKSYLQQAQDTAGDLYSKASANLPSQEEAQGTSKTYVETAQNYAQQGLKAAQDAVQG